ncbi:hypothetical protein E2C01_083452 [Portunus trituberculatus]|uniref:Uncharacterized protein n=1 Tax=Portunus trituberculatus TaxID=210409 RepID=A0A5B7J814_PORTR|nr:hypothetical protein [Portunus trituberculatus]
MDDGGDISVRHRGCTSFIALLFVLPSITTTIYHHHHFYYNTTTTNIIATTNNPSSFTPSLFHILVSVSVITTLILTPRLTSPHL